MEIRIAKFVAGLILSISIAMGIAIGLVYIIPIRGEALTMVVAPITAIVGGSGFIIIANRVGRR